MQAKIEYAVVSESEGVITSRETKQEAKARADELNNESGLPDDHSVEKTTERY